MFWLLACSSTYLPPEAPIQPPPDHRPLPPLDTGDPIEPPEEEVKESEAPIVVPLLIFNEVAPANKSLYQSAKGNISDYLEIYNPTTETVLINRIAVRDGSGSLWFGSEGELAPGGFLLLEAGGTGANHLPFGLGKEDDSFTLLVDGVEVDRMAPGRVADDVLWARFPDGGAWKPTIYPSAGSSNGESASSSLDPTTRLYQLDSVRDIYLTIDTQGINSLTNNRLSYVHGEIEIDGIQYDDVGIRLKAYVGSARTISQKCGWKVDLNLYEDRAFAGETKLTLNNMVQDPSYIHERLSYLLFGSMGVPSPRVAYKRVYLNGSLIGLYLLVESVDKHMLGRWFDDADGNVYEGAYGVDLTSGYLSSFDQEQGEETDRSDLQEVIDILEKTPTDSAVAELEKKVDLDEVLTERAVESLLLHWDGYTTSNNYRLYHDPISDRFSMIPWGTDQTFVNLYYGPWSGGSTGGGGVLWSWCLRNNACAERYDQKLIDAANEMDRLDLKTEAERLVSLILPDIQTDPRREFGLTTFQSYYDSTISTIQTWPQSVRDQVAAH